ncbi:unnamed protein product [Musa acuminata subsp. burmannicoides]
MYQSRQQQTAATSQHSNHSSLLLLSIMYTPLQSLLPRQPSQGRKLKESPPSKKQCRLSPSHLCSPMAHLDQELCEGRKTNAKAKRKRSEVRKKEE